MCTSNFITPTVKQTWVILPTILYKISFGMTFGYTSCLQKAIQDPKSGIEMDKDLFSWYVSCVGISLMVGYLLAMLLSGLGRRMSFLICCLPAATGLIVTALTTEVIPMIICRILIGISCGSQALIGSIVIGEYTSPSNRGMFFNMSTASLNAGSLLMHIMGEYIDWKTLAIIIHAPFIASIMITYTWPESPSWLAERKQFEKSREAFFWLRGRTEETTKEIEELIRAQDFTIERKTIQEHIENFFNKFRMKNFWKPMMISFLASVLTETGGRHLIPSYAMQLIQAMRLSGLNSFHYNLVVDAMILIGSFMAVYLVRVMNLRTLLFSSGISSCILLVLASLMLYIVNTDILSSHYSWIPLLLFATFCITTNFASTNVSFIVMGELFPLEHRVVASSLSWYISALLITITLKVLPYLITSIQIYGTFVLLSAVSAMVLLILYFILPETKDRTLLEVENYLKYGKYRDGELVPINVEDNSNKNT